MNPIPSPTNQPTPLPHVAEPITHPSPTLNPSPHVAIPSPNFRNLETNTNTPRGVFQYHPIGDTSSQGSSEGSDKDMQEEIEVESPAQPDQPFISNLSPHQQLCSVGVTTSSVPVHNPDSLLANDEDGLVSDSGDESEHYAENLEIPEIAPQGDELVEFITKKLEIVRKVIEEVEASNLPTSSKQDQVNDEGKLVNTDQDQCVAFTEEGHLVNNKEKWKIVTRSARRRKRGALLLQAEEM